MRHIPEVRVPFSSPVPISPVLGGNLSCFRDLVGASSHFAVLGDESPGTLVVDPLDTIILFDTNSAGHSYLHGVRAITEIGFASGLLPSWSRGAFFGAT